MKKVTVLAKFPDVIVNGYAVEYANATPTEASTLKAAISRAIGQALKIPELKRKRIKHVTFEIVVNE